MTDGPAVETVDLAKQYGRVRALDGLTMTIERGEVFGLLGPNGAGKTTVVKLLLGLAARAAAAAGSSARRSAICRRGDGSATSPSCSAISRGCGPGRCWPCTATGPPAARGLARAIDSSLGLVGLADRAEDIVGTFSKGMQQRLGLGVALLGAPTS